MASITWAENGNDSYLINQAKQLFWNYKINEKDSGSGQK